MIKIAKKKYYFESSEKKWSLVTYEGILLLIRTASALKRYLTSWVNLLKSIKTV